ncbi:aromatic motif membrane protein [Ureaplasma canigenitalium]|uniref:aromatic motif membrane protein n=1 Tax=Ureaplasma canigenitalium TaxID=42092 RepID=UPI0004E188AB|nr:aromatic motif membrane protein [Ureaplasma canigenitalium]
MLKSKKTKLWLSSTLGILSVALPITVIAACTPSTKSATASSLVSSENEFIDKLLPDSELEAKWNLFLRSSVIDQLLKYTFPNEKERNEFIKSQVSIPQSYLTELREIFTYNNDLNDDNPFGYNPYTKTGIRYPLPYNKYKFIEDELLRKNWLWYIFNIDNFIFTLEPEGATDSTIKTSFKDIAAENSLKKQLYRPQSNQFIDYVFVTYDSPGHTPAYYKREAHLGSEYANQSIKIYMVDKEGRAIRDHYAYHVEVQLDENGRAKLYKKDMEVRDSNITIRSAHLKDDVVELRVNNKLAHKGEDGKEQYFDLDFGSSNKNKKVVLSFNDASENEVRVMKDSVIETQTDGDGDFLISNHLYNFDENSRIVKILDQSGQEIPFSKLKYFVSDASRTFNKYQMFALMNRDGYWIELRFLLHYQNDVKDNKPTLKFVKSDFQINSNLYTLRDLYDYGSSLLTNFNLAKYYDVFYGTQGNENPTDRTPVPPKYSNIFQTIFNESYGSSQKPDTYKIVDMVDNDQ